MPLSSLLLQAAAFGVLLILTRFILSYWTSPLKNIPGPFMAKFTNIWRLYDHYCQTHIETQRKLHEKHGDIVRIGPTTISVADPSLVKAIYNTRGTLVKVRLLMDSRKRGLNSNLNRATSIPLTTRFKMATFSKISSVLAATSSTRAARSPFTNSMAHRMRCKLSP